MLLIILIFNNDQNEGTCVDGTCNCKIGYTGNRCEINPTITISHMNQTQVVYGGNHPINPETEIAYYISGDFVVKPSLISDFMENNTDTPIYVKVDKGYGENNNKYFPVKHTLGPVKGKVNYYKFHSHDVQIVTWEKNVTYTFIRSKTIPE